MKKNTIALILTTLTSAAYAENVTNPALACTQLTDNTMRLACFDKVYAQQFPPTQPIATLQQDTSPKAVDLKASYQNSVENKSAQVVFSNDDSTKLQQSIANAVDAYTPLSQLYDLDKNNESGLFTVREHGSMYLIPAWYNASPNYYPQSPTRGTTTSEAQYNQKRIEAKMQISFKSKLMEDLFKTRADLWFGYTQQSNWQVYNQGKKSAPFRNTDYAPEIFLTQPVKAELPFGGKLRMLGAGFIHQSNGQSRPASRSWNRLYLMAGMEWGKLTVIPRLWTRLDPGSNEDDDNPDITKYMGYGDIRLSYQLNNNSTLASTMRYNPKYGKGAVQLEYSFPIKGKLRAYVQGFHGYGENLIDYNHKQTSIGIGLMFKDWDGM